MNKYLISYVYYNGDMNIIHIAEDSNYIICHDANKALEHAMDYLTGQLDIVDTDGTWTYYTDELGMERAVQVRIYDEYLMEVEV